MFGVASVPDTQRPWPLDRGVAALDHARLGLELGIDHEVLIGVELEQALAPAIDHELVRTSEVWLPERKPCRVHLAVADRERARRVGEQRQDRHRLFGVDRSEVARLVDEDVGPAHARLGELRIPVVALGLRSRSGRGAPR